jgi:glucosamine--fructose-6-phosphate aminotransferase (isomerizing)
VPRLGVQMASEMAQQPRVLSSLVQRRAAIGSAVRPLFGPGLAGTVVVARGSSDHAATCGSYLLEMATGRPVARASPSLHLLYGSQVDFSGYVVIGASQSGRTPEIAAMLRRAGAAGGRTVAVTNDETSPLADAAEVVVALDAGEEKAVPATKTAPPVPSPVALRRPCPVHQGQQPGDGALAAAALTHQRHDLPLPDAEAHVFHRVQGAP